MITLDEIKFFIGVTDTSLDSQILAYIPIIEDKVKQITNNEWFHKFSASTKNGSKRLYVSGDSYFWDYVQAGMKVLDEDGSELTVVDRIDTMSQELFVQDTFAKDSSGTMYLGINISLLPVIAKGVKYLIDGKEMVNPEGEVASKSMGVLSVTYRDPNSGKGAGIAQSDMPDWFVRGLPRWA